MYGDNIVYILLTILLLYTFTCIYAPIQGAIAVSKIVK